MKGTYIFLAEGFEETEALATLDILRRGGIDVETVAIEEDALVTGAHGITVIADMLLYELLETAAPKSTSRNDVMIFPGGMPGTKNLAAKEELMEIMKEHFIQGGAVAAICAAPGLVVSQLDEIQGFKFTCFDGCEEATIAKGAEYVKQPAVTDRNLITGRGPGCAIEFGLHILEYVKGAEAMAKVRSGLMI